MRTRPAPTLNRPVNARSVDSGASSASSLIAIGPSAVSGGGLLVERLEVGEAEIVRLDRKGRRVPVRSLRRYRPRSRRTGRRDRGARASSPNDRRRRRNPCRRRSAASPRCRSRNGRWRGSAGRAPGWRRPWLRRAARRARRGRVPLRPPAPRWAEGSGSRPNRSATASDSAPSAATRRRRSSPSSSSRRTRTSSNASRERIEAEFAARRREHRSACGVAHRETFEAQTDAPRIVHEIGGPESRWRNGRRRAPGGGLDLVVHADQPKRPSRQQRGQGQPADDEQGRDELHRPETNMRDPAGADPAPARAKARTLGIRRHAAHSGPGASPRRHAISNDQYRSPSVAHQRL